MAPHGGGADPTTPSTAADPLNSDRAVPTSQQLGMPLTGLRRTTVYGWSTSG